MDTKGIMREYNESKAKLKERYDENKDVPGIKAWYDKQIEQLDEWAKAQKALWVDGGK